MSKPIIFLKSLVSGYTRKDGTFVKPHSDKRTKRADAADGQLALFPTPPKKPVPPSPFKGLDPVASTPDLFADASAEPARREEAAGGGRKELMVGLKGAIAHVGKKADIDFARLRHDVDLFGINGVPDETAFKLRRAIDLIAHMSGTGRLSGTNNLRLRDKIRGHEVLDMVATIAHDLDNHDDKLDAVRLWFAREHIDPAHNPENIQRMADGARKHEAHEAALREADKPRRDAAYEAAIARAPEFETLDGVEVMRSPGSRYAAVPVTGKRSSRIWQVFDVNTREPIAQLRKDEVTGWLVKMAQE